MRTESIHEKHNHLMEGRDTHKNNDSAKQKNPLSEKADVEAGILVHTHLPLPFRRFRLRLKLLQDPGQSRL